MSARSAGWITIGVALLGIVTLGLLLVGGPRGASGGAVILTTAVDPQGVVERKSPTGLRYVDLRVGDGPMPKIGQTVVIDYVGHFGDGRKFVDTYENGKPQVFQLGQNTIAGWTEGISTMRVGGKRKLTVPPELAYGPQGMSGQIPSNATLVFEVELKEIR